MKSSEKSAKHPMTPAVQFLCDHGVEFTPHLYPYVDRGGTAVSSRALGVSETIVIKTLVFENQNHEPLIVLMHGDKQVSLKELARQIGCKSITPCKPQVADRHSGYQVGGTSPFATRKKLPIYLEASITELPEIYINGGGRGFLVSLATSELVRVLQPTLVSVAQAK